MDPEIIISEVSPTGKYHMISLIGEIKKMIQGALLPPLSGEVGPVQSASCAPAPRTRLQEPGAPRDDRIAQAVPLAEQ